MTATRPESALESLDTRQDRLRGRSCRMQVVPARRSRGTDVDACRGTEGEPSGLVTGGRWAGFSPWLTKYPKGQCRTSRGSAKRFALAAPGLRPTGCLTPHPVSQMAAARGGRCPSPWLAASEQVSGSQSQAAPRHPTVSEESPRTCSEWGEKGKAT